MKIFLSIEQSFLLCTKKIWLLVKTAYNVALASKSLVNQQTARAALTQTVNLLFSRMEAEAIQNNYHRACLMTSLEP